MKVGEAKLVLHEQGLRCLLCEDEADVDLVLQGRVYRLTVRLCVAHRHVVAEAVERGVQ